jgi:hypothetical protein
VRVALPLSGSEPPIVALTNRLPGRATAATGVEQPEVERSRPAVEESVNALIGGESHEPVHAACAGQALELVLASVF